MKTLKCYLLTLCKGGTAAFCAAFVCIMSPKLAPESYATGFGAGLVALFASLPLLSSQKRTLATAD